MKRTELCRCRVRVVEKENVGPHYRELSVYPHYETPSPAMCEDAGIWQGDHWRVSTVYMNGVLSTLDTWHRDMPICDLVMWDNDMGFHFQKADFTGLRDGLGI